jgi:aspartyl-tRNA synthetase
MAAKTAHSTNPFARVAEAFSTRSSLSSVRSDRSGHAKERREAKRIEKAERLERRVQEQEAFEEQRRRKYENGRRMESPDLLVRYGEGDAELLHPSELSTIAEIASMSAGTEVTFRARIQHQRRISDALDFLLFRDQTQTIQGVVSRTSTHMIKWVQRLPTESLVEVTGTLQKPEEPVRSASIQKLEVSVFSIHLVSPATQLLFDNYHPPESLHQRMSDRVVDLRHPSNQALFRLRAAVTRTFREILDDDGFIEIQTPKLQPAATESGAEVFQVKYFGRKAFLAQSPQLAKQMTISADFKKVYEVSMASPLRL